MQERPRFRNDLVARPVSEGGQRFVDVTDPESGSTFRFYEVEYAVACAMNGQRDTGGLQQWSQVELGLEPSPQEIETVVTTLGELGYLDTSEQGGEDVALGQAGKSPIAAPRSAPAAPDDFELGHAGPGNEPDQQDAAINETGGPEGSDVSVDLSQHLSIGKDDVKEAVRQSRVMSAVGAPEDEDDETEIQPAPVSRAEVAAAEAKPTEQAIAEEVRNEVKKDAGSSGAKPITIPAKSPAVARTPAPAEPEAAQLPEAEQTPAPSGGGAMTFVLIILLLGVLGVGGWFVYTNFLQKPADPASQLETEEPVPVKKKNGPSQLS